MATTNIKTFPGVYTQIIDQSFIQPVTSRFKPGLIGVATKGPFNVPTPVRSLKDYRRLFGKPLTTTYTDGLPDNGGFFMADAVGILSDLTDGITVVRVGNQYEEQPVSNGAGAAGSFSFLTNVQQSQQLNPTGGVSVYVRLQEPGKASTVNAQVVSAANGTVNLFTSGDALSATYTNATIAFSNYAGAANSGEGVLNAYTYAQSASGTLDYQLTTYGTVVGTKNQFSFTVQANANLIQVGEVYKIRQPSLSDPAVDERAATHEVRVKSVVGSTVYLETSDITRFGYQSLPLQDSYATGRLYKVTGKVPFLHLEAATTGEWANGSSTRTGLHVQVRPGSTEGTKKLEVFEDGAIVETHDNLSDDPASEDWYETRLNGISQYIVARYVYSAGSGQKYHAANTVAAWDAAYAVKNIGSQPKSMPVGAVNAGGTTGGQFTMGYNGANAQDADFIGTVNPEDDSATGIKVFEDTDNIDINVLCAPMDDISIGVMQEINRVARKINALAIADVPAGLNARHAIDWHNGTGVYLNRGKIDSPNIAIYWNWFNTTDPFTGLTKLVPPTLAALRCMAYTFDRDKPWYAAAGETRGVIPEALSVEFDKVSIDVKHAMYGNGNSVNPILKIRGRYVLYGERTLQRAESKLTAVHSVILVNYTVNGLAQIGRRFVFDPNDNELLVHIRLAFSEFLDKIRNERGIEEYELVVDDRNNTPDTRNRREVIVDLSIIPTDVAERIFINATVRESGATLNNATG